MEYIDKLNRLRTAKNLSFRQLGLMCDNLSESAVKKILSKKCAPLLPSLAELCEAIGTTLPELLCGADERVIKVTGDAAALLTVYASLPAEAKKYLWLFLKAINEK